MNIFNNGHRAPKTHPKYTHSQALMQPYDTLEVSHSLEKVVKLCPCFSLGKGEVMGSSPIEGTGISDIAVLTGTQNAPKNKI